MALTRNNAQIQWSAADSITLSSSAVQTSDAVAFDATDVACAITVYADNQGTPASGDTVVCYVMWTTGDVITGGGDDYDTIDGATFIAVLDTYTNTPTSGIVQKTVDVPISAKGFKLAVSSANAATRNMVVKARYATQRAA